MLTKLIINMAVKLPKLESFNHYLFIGPHPDDIEIGAGATINRLVNLGKQITFLIALDGRYGDAFSNGVKGDDLALLRKSEAIASAKALGVTDVRFLDLCDGAGYSFDELTKRIAIEVGKVKPDIIFAPDSLSKSECHLDHINVGNAARIIANFAPYDGIMQGNYGATGCDVKALALYMTARPNRFMKVSKEDVDRQLKALKIHASQYPKDSNDYASITTYIKLRSIEFGIRSFKGRAEGFRIYDRTRMHCLPEAN